MKSLAVLRFLGPAAEQSHMPDPGLSAPRARPESATRCFAGDAMGRGSPHSLMTAEGRALGWLPVGGASY
jgi:hypothetical protein